MKYKTFLILLSACSMIACSCAEKEDKTKEESEHIETIIPDEVAEVTVIKIKPSVFNHEMVSNGKISAKRIAKLKFESANPIADIYVKNGDRVKKGQKIAELATFRLANKTAQAKATLDNASLELQDVLIGQGYKLKDSLKVPLAIIKLAKVKSGYDHAEAQYEWAKYELEQATLRAPFNGSVANLFTKPFNTASTTEAFCSIIDNNSLEADFTILESELPLIREGDKVNVTPFALKNMKGEGRVSEINPIVDKNGMVRVKAAVNGFGKLFEGMNVRVNINRAMPNKIVVPKTAVVMRSGKGVVFTYKDGKAFWNYVQIGFENSDSYTIENNVIKTGDRVISSGNVNLAHESPVKIVEAKTTD